MHSFHVVNVCSCCWIVCMHKQDRRWKFSFYEGLDCEFCYQQFSSVDVHCPVRFWPKTSHALVSMGSSPTNTGCIKPIVVALEIGDLSMFVCSPGKLVFFSWWEFHKGVSRRIPTSEAVLSLASGDICTIKELVAWLGLWNLPDQWMMQDYKEKFPSFITLNLLSSSTFMIFSSGRLIVIKAELIR